MLYTYKSLLVLPRLLKYADRNSMRFSISLRTSFADDIDLIEYIFLLPGVYKIHNDWNKYLLPESMKNIVPKQIRERVDKIGFAVPENDWLQSIKPFVLDAANSDINSVLKIPQIKKNRGKICINQDIGEISNLWRYANFILWFNILKVTL